MAKKGKKKGKRRRPRKKGSSKKRIQMGLAGKIGAAIAGVGPMLVTSVGTVADAINRNKIDISIGSNLEISFKEWINGMAKGYGFGAPYESTDAVMKDGSIRPNTFIGDAHIPKGSHIILTGIGLLQVGVDRVISFVNSKRGVNLPGTRIRVIGNM